MGVAVHNEEVGVIHWKVGAGKILSKSWEGSSELLDLGGPF
jgi:hypothetical protein